MLMDEQNRLQKKIGFWSSTSIIIGSVIGAGVFMKPATMAEQLGSPIWLALTWVIAGVFSLFGALIYAELGAMMPETGGIYVYFRKMFGEFIAFLYGWAAFSVINTAAVASISFVCASYADYFLHLPRFSEATEHAYAWHIPFIGDLYPLENFGVKMLAVAVIIGITALNYLSVKAGSMFQVLSTFLKMAVIAALIFGIFFSGNGTVENFTHAEHPQEGWSLLSGVIVAMTGAFYAYDGWINITFIAGEIRQPQRNIPKSLILGVFTCIAIYLLVNQAYLYVLPVESIAGSSLVAADAISIAIGKTGGAIVAAMIVICTLGAVNGNTLSTCRITYAMGQDKVFLPWAGKTHKKFSTPGNALWLHGIWTSLFIITGSFDMLADMFVFITWIAYGAGAVGIFLLRKKMAEVPRPYRIWGYPIIPILFIIFTAFYLVTTIWNDVSNYLAHRQPVINSVLGMLITALGVPVYYYYKWRRSKTSGL
jgi:APA family basic amino acid/polyamine antiporter